MRVDNVEGSSATVFGVAVQSNVGGINTDCLGWEGVYSLDTIHTAREEYHILCLHTSQDPLIICRLTLLTRMSIDLACKNVHRPCLQE